MLPQLFEESVRRDAGSPFLTFYDDASGERIELSRATTANWVAKTANLLTDELDLVPGETVSIALPPHWLGVVWALSAWSCNATLAGSGGDIAFVGPDSLEVRGTRETVATALLPLGGRFAEALPAGVLDYGAEVYNHGDVFVPMDPPLPGSPAYEDRTHAELASEPVADRVLTTADLVTAEHIGLLGGVIAGGGSLVLCRNLDPDKLERRVTDEKADRVMG